MRHVLCSDGERVSEALALDELDPVPVVAAEQQPLLEELLDAIDGLEPVEVDGPRCPVALQSDVAPGPDVRVSAQPGLRIDGVELGHGQALEGIVLVDEDDRGGRLPQRTHAAGRHLDGERLVAELVDECLLLGRQQLAAHGSQLGASVSERRAAGAGGARLHRDAEARIRLAEEPHPAERDLVHHVGADQVQFLLGRDGELGWFPGGDGRIDGEPVLGRRILEREGGRGGEGGENRCDAKRAHDHLAGLKRSGYEAIRCFRSSRSAVAATKNSVSLFATGEGVL